MDIAKLLSSNDRINASTGGESNLSKISGYLTTGSFVADTYLNGGIPIGRISEMFGPPGCGKTAVAFHAMKDCQDKGGLCVLMATEVAWDVDKAKKMGVKVDEIIVTHPESVELLFEVALSILRTAKDTSHIVTDKATINGLNHYARLINDFRIRCLENPELPICIVVDSLSQAPIETIIAASKDEGSQYAGGMMERPRVIGERIKLVTIPIAKAKCAFIVINQISQGPGAGMYGTPEFDSTGGNALKHSYSLRLMMDFKSRDEYGQVTKLRALKNRQEKPNIRWECYQYYYTGFDLYTDLYDNMIKFELIMSGRGWEGDSSDMVKNNGSGEASCIRDGKESVGLYWNKGYDNFKKFMEENPTYRDSMVSRCTDLIRQNVIETDWESDVESDD